MRRSPIIVDLFVKVYRKEYVPLTVFRSFHGSEYYVPDLTICQQHMIDCAQFRVCV